MTTPEPASPDQPPLVLRCCERCRQPFTTCNDESPRAGARDSCYDYISDQPSSSQQHREAVMPVGKELPDAPGVWFDCYRHPWLISLQRHSMYEIDGGEIGPGISLARATLGGWLPASAPLGEGERERQIASLFDALAHGDEEHRAWLKQAIADHFAGRPVAAVAGRGSKETIAALTAELSQARDNHRAASTQLADAISERDELDRRWKQARAEAAEAKQQREPVKAGLEQAANWLRRNANWARKPETRAAFIEAHNAIMKMVKDLAAAPQGGEKTT